MAVSKEELFARYKQLKAEGVSISIMELKKQMEAEANSSSSTETTPAQTSGFSALNHSTTEQTPTQIQQTENNFQTQQADRTSHLRSRLLNSQLAARHNLLPHLRSLPLLHGMSAHKNYCNFHQNNLL